MPSQVTLKNNSQRNTLKVNLQDGETVDNVDKNGKPAGGKTVKWRQSQLPPVFIAPGTSSQIYLEAGKRRVMLEEQPT